MPAVRRVAAILAADVGADEEGTHERLKAHRRKIIDPKISEHSGRIVNTAGDGILAEFASVVDAVRGAAEWQLAMTDRAAAIPEDRRIRFRIGINLGDVIVEDDDIFGDGVNVAARLESTRRAGWDLHLADGARPDPRQAGLRFRGSWRAECQEHRSAGACIRVAPRSDCGLAGRGRAS